MSRTIVVDRENVEAAQALIQLRGGPEHVDPLIVKIANAQPRSRAVRTRRS